MTNPGPEAWRSERELGQIRRESASGPTCSRSHRCSAPQRGSSSAARSVWQRHAVPPSPWPRSHRACLGRCRQRGQRWGRRVKGRGHSGASGKMLTITCSLSLDSRCGALVQQSWRFHERGAAAGGRSQKVAICLQAKERSHRKNQSCCPLDLGPQTSRTVSEYISFT